jgi:transcriptional regulator with XRE-family HTH domain
LGGVPVGFEAGGMTAPGWLLRAARRRSGLTLADGARVAGVDPAVYAAAESAGRTLSDEAYGEAFAALMQLPDAPEKWSPRRGNTPQAKPPPGGVRHGHDRSVGSS